MGVSSKTGDEGRAVSLRGCDRRCQRARVARAGEDREGVLAWRRRPVLSSWQHPGVRRAGGLCDSSSGPFGQHPDARARQASCVDALVRVGPTSTYRAQASVVFSERGVARLRGASPSRSPARLTPPRSGVRAGSGAHRHRRRCRRGVRGGAARAAAPSKGAAPDPSSALRLTRLTARTRCLRRRDSMSLPATRGRPHSAGHGDGQAR